MSVLHIVTHHFGFDNQSFLQLDPAGGAEPRVAVVKQPDPVVAMCTVKGIIAKIGSLTQKCSLKIVQDRISQSAIFAGLFYPVIMIPDYVLNPWLIRIIKDLIRMIISYLLELRSVIMKSFIDHQYDCISKHDILADTVS